MLMHDVTQLVVASVVHTSKRPIASPVFGCRCRLFSALCTGTPSSGCNWELTVLQDRSGCQWKAFIYICEVETEVGRQVNAWAGLLFVVGEGFFPTQTQKEKLIINQMISAVARQKIMQMLEVKTWVNLKLPHVWKCNCEIYLPGTKYCLDQVQQEHWGIDPGSLNCVPLPPRQAYLIEFY